MSGQLDDDRTGNGNGDALCRFRAGKPGEGAAPGRGRRLGRGCFEIPLRRNRGHIIWSHRLNPALVMTAPAAGTCRSVRHFGSEIILGSPLERAQGDDDRPRQNWSSQRRKGGKARSVGNEGSACMGNTPAPSHSRSRQKLSPQPACVLIAGRTRCAPPALSHGKTAFCRFHSRGLFRRGARMWKRRERGIRRGRWQDVRNQCSRYRP